MKIYRENNCSAKQFRASCIVRPSYYKGGYSRAITCIYTRHVGRHACQIPMYRRIFCCHRHVRFDSRTNSRKMTLPPSYLSSDKVCAIRIHYARTIQFRSTRMRTSTRTVSEISDSLLDASKIVLLQPYRSK